MFLNQPNGPKERVSRLTTSEHDSVESTLLNKFLLGKTTALRGEDSCSLSEMINHLRSRSTSNLMIEIPFSGRSTLVHH